MRAARGMGSFSGFLIKACSFAFPVILLFYWNLFLHSRTQCTNIWTIGLPVVSKRRVFNAFIEVQG